MYNLTAEQIQYLRDRGFEIIEGNPDESAPFPYVELTEEPGLSSLSDCLFFNIGDGGPGCSAHPNKYGTDELVNLIEACASMYVKSEFISGLIPQGTPIKIFVEDPAWMKVAEAVVAKYQ